MTDIGTSDQIHRFIDDLESSLDMEFGPLPNYSNVILCGMGGSGITGDMVADLLSDVSPIPIRTMKSTVLPNWAGCDTLVVVSSYSGNTLETREVYAQALERGCRVIVITSGGALKAMSEKNGNDMILMPEGMHPRHSIGFMIGYTLAVLRSAGCGDISSRIKDSIPGLRRYRDMLESTDGTNLPLEMAESFIDHVPVICAGRRFGSVILRWKTQFNENSKYVAFCIPSDDIVHGGLCSCRWKDVLSLTVLVGSRDDSIAEAIETLDRSGICYRCVDFDGDSEMENFFRMVMLGDLISMHMAGIRGIDPASVKPITHLKNLLRTIQDDRVQ